MPLVARSARPAGLWAAFVVAVSLAACGPIFDSQVKAFAEADGLLAAGRYEQAIRAYDAFARTYPGSHLADDAYMRIAYIYLHRSSETRSWPGWDGADYRKARETLDRLVRRYPASDRTFESRNWISLLDEYLALATLRLAASDSTRASTELRRDGAFPPARPLRDALARSGERNARLVAERDSLRASARRLAAANDDLRKELERVWSDTERMRSLLIELERRSGDF